MPSPRLYDSSLAVGAAVFPPPSTPRRSPTKDVLQRARSPAKQSRAYRGGPVYEEYRELMSDDTSTAAEKELASRVLSAAEKLKAWCQEIEQWGWSGSFEVQHIDNGPHPLEHTELEPSIPPGQVDEYDSRLDVIETDFFSLGVDEFKIQIQGIYLDRSRPTSSYSIAKSSNPVIFDKFQLFVTDALIYLLPLQATLEQYLQTWKVRIAVLLEVPKYLQGLKLLDQILLDAWNSLRDASVQDSRSTDLDTLGKRWKQAEQSLRSCVAEIGSKLDRMLDMLENHEDCLPAAWIDHFDDQEKTFADWAFESDRKIFQLRLLEQNSHEAQIKARSGATESAPRLNEADMPLTRPDTILGTSEPSIPIHHQQPGQSSEVDSTDIRHVADLQDLSDSQDGEDDKIQYEEKAIVSEAVHRPVEAVLRRASVTSIESFKRDQVKSVDVSSRRNSATSLVSIKRLESQGLDSAMPPLPNESAFLRFSKPTSPLAVETTAEWPNIQQGTDEFNAQTSPGTTAAIRRSSMSSITSASSGNSEPGADGEESPSMRASKKLLAKPPLNHAMKKRRSRNLTEQFRSSSDLNAGSDSEMGDANVAAPHPFAKHKPPAPASIPLEDQISNIIESLPARFKLKSSSAPNAPEVKPKHSRRTSVSSTVSTTSDVARPAFRSRAATPSHLNRPTITLAPADDVGLRRGVNDPEIKVYHLMSENEKPLKLFVRRVGENGERVMVRVGGGWADLAEYLRNYAEHHGHRTVSDGGVQVLGLGNDREGTPTPSSGGRNSSLGFRNDNRIEGRSESRLGMRVDSLQSVRQEPRSSSTTGSIGFPSQVTGHNAISSPATALDSPVPTSASSPVTSTPGVFSETGTPLSATASKRSSSFWEDGGLMGPAAAKKGGEISGEKKEWVDSIVEQAKKVGRKVDVADLGKKGGTRRVFLKGGKTGAGIE